MKFGVVIFPGSNCDQDCFWAVKHVLKETARYIWHQDTDIRGFDCIILPGGAAGPQEKAHDDQYNEQAACLGT